MKTKTKIDLAASIIIIIILFAFSSYLVSVYLPQIREVIDKYYFQGMLVFILVEALAIVLAPLTSTPLVPIASQTYGIFITFLLFYIGNFFGSLFAFFLAKNFGKRIVSNFISLEKAEDLVEGLSKKNKIFSLIILRIIVPADILSYSLGIFTKINYRIFIITLIIGSIPGTLYFAILGTLSIFYQLISWGIAILVILILYYLLKRANS